MSGKLLFLALIGTASLIHTPVLAEGKDCDQFGPVPEHFRALYEQAKAIGEQICLGYVNPPYPGRVEEQYEEFALDAKEAAMTAFKGKSFAGQLEAQMDYFVELAGKGIDGGRLPSFTITPGSGFTDAYAGFADSHDEKVHFDKQSAECAGNDQPDCETMFRALSDAIEPYKRPYSTLTAADVKRRASAVVDLWEGYFNDSRAQTLLDAALTSGFAHDHLSKKQLVGPMDTQWFAVHPSIVIENVRKAADGQQMEQALAMEWIGFNWWNGDSSPVGIPFGISIASLYSDRPGIDDVGHGVMFHFYNSTSIGWADHDDGNEGIYVTADLLSLFTEKRTEWKQYKAALEEWRGD